jgi:rhodanese-related sulfurtransferase
MSKSKRHQKASGQHNLLIVIGVVTAIALLGGAIALLSPPAAETGYPAEISVAEAAAKRDQGVFILDVRTPAEWQEYHVPGSTLIPLDELPSRLDEVPRDQEVVVVCRSGNRSATGRDMLRQAGFTQVTSLAGGLSQWRSQGYPTVAGQ